MIEFCEQMNGNQKIQIACVCERIKHKYTYIRTYARSYLVRFLKGNRKRHLITVVNMYRRQFN